MPPAPGHGQGEGGARLLPPAERLRIGDIGHLHADFYRAGDANDESFIAQIIVSQDDIASDIPGVQNVWVQGVGCGAAQEGVRT